MWWRLAGFASATSVLDFLHELAHGGDQSPPPQKSNADRLRTFFSRGAALGRSDYAFKAEENRTRIHGTDIGMSPSKNVCEFVLVVASGLGRSEYCSARAAVRREVVQL